MKRKEYKKFIKYEIGNGFKGFIRSHFDVSFNSVYLIRKSQYIYSKGKMGKIISKYYTKKLVKKYGIFIKPNKKIGLGLRIPHPNGIIIGTNGIGENCTIFQQVTIGSARVGDFKKHNQPLIGDNCIFFSGCKVLGKIIVEDGTIVGANAVLTKNTEKNSTYVGIPAHKVEKKS